MGVWPRLLQIMHTLYYAPQAQVHMQDQFSSPISIAQGTQQGCPLSPLNFVIVIETLEVALWTKPDIQEVRCGEHDHKCALFKDDLLMLLTSPITSTPKVFWLLQEFGRVYGSQYD